MTRAMASLCEGEVVHKRLRPTDHKLRYRVFSMMVDVDRFSEVAKMLRLFSVDGLNIFSLKQSAHGFRDGRSVSDFAWAQVKQCGIADRVKRIDMLFYPRLFGFAFNPLTVYFCRGEAENIELMIYEVRNTFGENLTYVVSAGAAHGGTYSHTIGKQFYVSPFNEVDGDYTFHVRESGDETTVGVALRDDNGPLLRTHFRGRHTPLTDRALAMALFRYPLMTLKIVAGIHWEALKLWRKGMVLQDRPPAPTPRIVYAPGLTSSGA